MTPRTERRRKSDIEIDGPFGIKARFFGKEITSVLLLALCAFGIAYLIWQHDRNSGDRMLSLEQHMEEMVYVMSRPEKEREKLNLAMPDSLRKKVRESP